MQRYNPKEIEPKWQKIWEDDKIYQATEDSHTQGKPKKYILEYFPYPSGAAMHVGHVRNYTIGDALARFNRMNGYNVLHPMGWDGFGLPAENYAIKNKISPRKAIDENTARFKQQLTQMGFSYDWSREIDSTDPRYYRWTQWLFLLLFRRGLAYQQDSLQWWCPVDKTVLANEQVEAGLCWRCGNPVEKKALKQWFFKITDYADRLEKDLDDVNWSDSIKHMQRNWIGRSKGAEIELAVAGAQDDAANADGKGTAADTTGDPVKIKVFTTRPDTLFGVTFMVVAPEHPIVAKITTDEQREKVQAYIKQTQAKSDIQRQETDREKTGVFTGAYAINPANNEKIPVWIADYVLYGYGTGAIMAVPAHDERDYAFARKFDLPIVRVVRNDAPDDACSHDEGAMMNSDPYDGLPSAEAREKIVADLAAKGAAREVTNYKLRDWLISRQRYWGAPIPIIHCPLHGAVPVPDDQLPVKLPDITTYEPSGDGRSPLATVPEFVNTTCPQCGGPAQRETDTMDGFACSSWYFLRFADPHDDEQAFDREKVDFWLPVDDYIGGAEHAVMHLLYARFWTKVMYDEGLIGFTEPFTTLRNHGMILAPDGQKMSKSKGNTIEPGVLIDQGYGADAIRIMELFIGPWNQAANWSVEGMGGAYRFLQRVWALALHLRQAELDGVIDAAETPLHPAGQAIRDQLPAIMHRTIKRVTQDIENLSFNTAIAALMEYVNALYKLGLATEPVHQDNLRAWHEAIETLLKLLAPFAPHITEELWSSLMKTDGQDGRGSIHANPWPQFDEGYLADENVTVVVQVNGKVRGSLTVARDADEAAVVTAARADANVARHLGSGQPAKTIYVPGKIVNFVVK